MPDDARARPPMVNPDGASPDAAAAPPAWRHAATADGHRFSGAAGPCATLSFPAPLPAGWYRVRLDGEGSAAVAAELVPDFGDATAATPLAVAGLDAGRTATVLLERPLAGCAVHAAAPVHAIEFHPVTRGVAMRRVVAEHGRLAPLDALASLARALLALPAGGGAAYAGLVSRHRRALARHAARGSTAPLRLGGHPAAWRPHRQLAPLAGGRWRADGDDPQFVLPAADLGAPLSPGWYRFDAALDGDGLPPPPFELHAVPDDAVPSTRAIALGAPHDGRITHFFRLVAPAVSLRFDPGSGPGEFGLVASRLRRVGRFGVAAGLLAGVAARRGAAAALATAARALVRGPAWLLAECQPGEADRVACVVAGRAALGFRPVHQLRRDADGGWQATGADPQFHLDGIDPDAPLPGGWYRFRARLAPVEGQVISPCLYPDYGDGFAPEELLLVADPDPHGRIDSLVLFKFPVRALRFDPSMRPVRFSFGQVSLRRLSKPRAVLAMLDGIRGDGGRPQWAGRARATAEFAAKLRRGLSGAAAGLYERYQHHQRQGAVSYDAWVRLHDTLGAVDLAAMRDAAARLPEPPMFSLLVPVYDTPEPWLRRCLDSVLAQAYPHWELCVADDASPAPHVRAVLTEYARRDPRIRLTFRERNGHISEASNTALAMARGDYVGLLDHDDELRPHALLAMAEAIVADRGVRLLYSDEDKIDERGRRFQPYFKPDWNPDLLLGQNYLCHFSVIHTALAREAGGFRAGFEGSQDHDLLLRCCERIGPARIAHVPRVLYHWRAIEGSTALRRDAKDYAADAGARAIADHLRRTGADAQVEQLPHGHYRVHWALPAPAPRVTIVIPTRDRLPLLRTCVESIFARTDYPDYRVLVVDNGSVEPETLAWLEAERAAGRLDVRRDDSPFNYARLNNAAVAACDGTVVALVNNDIEVIGAGWLTEMVSQALRPGVGAVGAMLYYPDDTIQHAGVVLGLGGVANHAYIRQPRGFPGHGGRAKVVQAMSAVTGACLVVRRDHYLDAGGLDESLQVAFNDIDFCLRLRQRGLRNLWTPFAELYHHESATRGREDSEEKLRRFHGEVGLMLERWGDWLHVDPAYNPNLTLEGFNFELAFPPRVPPLGAG